MAVDERNREVSAAIPSLYTKQKLAAIPALRWRHNDLDISLYVLNDFLNKGCRVRGCCLFALAVSCITHGTEISLFLTACLGDPEQRPRFLGLPNGSVCRCLPTSEKRISLRAAISLSHPFLRTYVLSFSLVCQTSHHHSPQACTVCSRFAVRRR